MAESPAAPVPSTALLAPGENAAVEFPDQRRYARVERLPMRLDVLMKVRSFRVQDLLAMQKGTVVETVHGHSQDVPLACGSALLVWGEFEVVEQKLGVRITHLA
jgi:flagellar motor switch/type III secretory pathway protein FliN